MIERCRNKATGGVTDTAVLIGCNMADFFRRSETGIVTGCAVIHDTRMIKCRRQKARGLVAIDAITVGRHMVVVFACGGNAVMT